jgi:hypothetical protein
MVGPPSEQKLVVRSAPYGGQTVEQTEAGGPTGPPVAVRLPVIQWLKILMIWWPIESHYDIFCNNHLLINTSINTHYEIQICINQLLINMQ